MQVLVVGAARGGTTAAAGVVRSFGIPFPDANDNHEAASILSAFIQRDGGLHRKLCEKYSSWGFKYPSFYRHPNATSMVVELPEPRIIAVFRDPFAVAEGRMREDGEQEVVKCCARVTQQYTVMQEWLDDLAGRGVPVLHMSYEKLCTRTRHEVERIRRFVDGNPAKSQQAEEYIRPGHYWPWRGDVWASGLHPVSA